MVLKRFQQRSDSAPVIPDEIELADHRAVQFATAPPVPPMMKRLNRAATWGIVVLVLSGWVSFLSHFVPSHITVQAAKGATLLIALLYFVFWAGVGRFGWDKNSPQVRVAMGRSRILAKAYIRAPFMTAVFAAFAWVSFSNVFPLVLNALIGSRGTMTVVVDGWQRSGRGVCAGPTLQGIPFGMTGSRALCFGDYSEVDFLRGTSLILVGRSSALGIAPESYRWPTAADQKSASESRRVAQP